MSFDQPGRDENLAEAILTIDLDAVAENYRRLAREAAPAAAAAVVKADAYGLGADQIAPALCRAGCGTFFVAVAEEGLRLRQVLGPAPTIFVLHGLPPGCEREAAEAGVTPVLNSLMQLDAWRAAAKSSRRRLPAALHLDSGMARLGLSAGEIDRITGNASAFEDLDLVLVASHLSCAEDPPNPANREQLARFEALRRRLPPAPASLANSSGIFLGKDWHFDLVRPGAALYGVNPTPGNPNPMRAAVRLKVRVIQTRSLVPGETVGYGGSFRAVGPMRAATLSFGYADGWPRAAATAAFFDGTRLPFLGRVSMDSVVVDISALPPEALRPGDWVEVIGEHQSVDDVGAAAGTIGYEVLTRLGRRPLRRYLGG